MSERIVDLIDAVLALAFWLPAHLFGYKKCGKCTVRVRWWQFLLLVTWPAARLPRVRARRLDWQIRTEIGGQLLAVELD